MTRPPMQIRTAVADLTEREWQQIRAAAKVLLSTCPRDCTPCGTIILPGRPATFVLRQEGSDFVLEEARGD